MVEIGIRYEGGYHSVAMHGPSGCRLETDAPADNMGRGAAFSPTDLAATSLATCMLTTMEIAVVKKGLSAELAGMSATVRKFMTAEFPRRIAKLEVDVFVPLPPDHPDRETLERVGRECPVARSLHPDVEQVVTFRWQAA